MEKKLTKPEELLARFRSKEDLYRYMTQHGKHTFGLLTISTSERVLAESQGDEDWVHERHLVGEEVSFKNK